MASFLCFGGAQVDPAATAKNSNGCSPGPEAQRPRVVDSNHLQQVDSLVAAKPKLVLGTPVDLAEASQLHALLQEKEDHAADVTGELQRLTVELREERARSAQLEAKEAEAEDSRILVTRMVAKAQLRAVTSAIAEEAASEAAAQMERDLAVLKQDAKRREDDLTAKVLELSQQLDDAREKYKWRKDKYTKLMARHVEKNQKLQEVTKRANDMEAQLQNMRCEMESLQRALVQLPVIPEEDCKVIKELGEGTYGKVTMRCIPVAVKEMKKPSDVLSLVKEQQMMARLRHPAIPAAMGWMRKNDGTAGLAIQYVDGMSMQQFREKRNAGEDIGLNPTGPAGLSLLQRLTEPIEHVHMQGYVHRDVSCRNIMLCEDYDGKFSPHLIDFGLAYDMRTPPTRWGGSPGFMRPVEILFPQSVGPADDIRGFCAVAWEFLTGHSIWHTLVHAYRAAIEVNFSIEEDVQFCCEEHDLNSGDLVQCMAAAEYLGHIGIREEHFEPLLKNPLMPANALRLIARGLSNAVARGEAPPPTPADIRAALQADIEEAEVAELMRILGRGL